MACTTILVGKKASYNNSTMIARNDDGYFDVKKLIVVNPKDQPRKYKCKISHLEIELPDNPVSYTSTPSVDDKHGIWAANGINAYNVGMTATETITSNSRVLGADPLVKYVPAKNKKEKLDSLSAAARWRIYSTFLYTCHAMTNCTATSPASSPKAAYRLAAWARAPMAAGPMRMPR